MINMAWLSRRSLLLGIVLAQILVACGSTAPAAVPTDTTPSPSASNPTSSTLLGSHLTVSGAFSGDVSNIRATCGEQQVVGNGYVAKYLSADGSLADAAFHMDIYDPAGPGSWEGQLHVYARVQPPNSDYYAWFTRASDGISEFGWTAGVKAETTVPPKTSADIQAGGLIPNGPITVTGRIVC
jgi:hypothetical protein